jgi:hypothetical protein
MESGGVEVWRCGLRRGVGAIGSRIFIRGCARPVTGGGAVRPPAVGCNGFAVDAQGGARTPDVCCSLARSASGKPNRTECPPMYVVCDIGPGLRDGEIGVAVRGTVTVVSCQLTGDR